MGSVLLVVSDREPSSWLSSQGGSPFRLLERPPLPESAPIFSLHHSRLLPVPKPRPWPGGQGIRSRLPAGPATI